MLLETLVHKLPFYLSIPSILLTVFEIYIIHTKSPPGMKGYQKILIALALVTLNFDLSLSVVVGPKPLPGAVGTENNGFIALLWSSGGRIQLWYTLLSSVIHFEFCVYGFSYRERTILRDKLPPWSKFYYSFQLLTYFLCALGMSIVYFNGAVDEEQARLHMMKTGRSYCQECSICVVTVPKNFMACGFVAVASMAVLNTFIGIAIYRIRRFLTLEKAHLSLATIKMQKMLLTALIWQSLVPFILVAAPVLLVAMVVILPPLIADIYKPQPLGEDLTGVALLMPSFFSIGHCFCTIYFTSPYKKYVAELFSWKTRTKPVGSDIPSIKPVDPIFAKK